MSRPASVPDLTGKRPPHARSAVSNGTRLPGGVSASSAEGRRFVDIMGDLTAQMGGALGPAEQLQVRTIAGLMLHVEQLQGAMLRGEAVDSEQITRASNSAARMLSALRRKVPAKPKLTGRAALDAHMAAKREAAA